MVAAVDDEVTPGDVASRRMVEIDRRSRLSRFGRTSGGVVALVQTLIGVAAVLVVIVLLARAFW
jgi:hypothetical protein